MALWLYATIEGVGSARALERLTEQQPRPTSSRTIPIPVRRAARSLRSPRYIMRSATRCSNSSKHSKPAQKRLPDVVTVSRLLASADAEGVACLRQLCRQLVLDRLSQLNLRRVTLDFDGSVIGTGHRAEGTAVGFNRAQKGPTQLLSAVLHRGADRPSLRPPASAWQRP